MAREYRNLGSAREEGGQRLKNKGFLEIHPIQSVAKGATNNLNDSILLGLAHYEATRGRRYRIKRFINIFTIYPTFHRQDKGVGILSFFLGEDPYVSSE